MLSFVSQKWAELQSAGEPLPSVAVCPSSAFCTAILSRVSLEGQAEFVEEATPWGHLRLSPSTHLGTSELAMRLRT